MRLQSVLKYSNQVTTWAEEHSAQALFSDIFSPFRPLPPFCKLCNHIPRVLLLWWHQQVEAHQDAECAQQHTHTAVGLIRGNSTADHKGTGFEQQTGELGHTAGLRRVGRVVALKIEQGKETTYGFSLNCKIPNQSAASDSPQLYNGKDSLVAAPHTVESH